MLQVRIISLGTQTALLEQVQSMFPDADVAVQRATDMRAVDPMDAYKDGHISSATLWTIKHGRKWHHELGSMGGVGLAHSNRAALRESLTQPLLLIEDDCVFRDPKRVVAQVAALLEHADEFEFAAFGALPQKFACRRRAVTFAPEWRWLEGDCAHFLMTHCVLYTPSGRRVLSAQLRREPLSMQIDSLYSVLIETGVCRAMFRRDLARQREHRSTIQESPLRHCYLCHLSPGHALPFAIAISLLAYCAARPRQRFVSLTRRTLPVG